MTRPPRTGASWAYCVSAFLKPYGLDLSEGLSFVMGSGLWLGLEQQGGFDERPDAQTSPTTLVALNPMAMEHLSALLHAPLMVYRRADARQTYWLVKRALLNRQTIIKLSDRALGGSGAPVYALVTAVAGVDEVPALPPADWRDEAVTIVLELERGVTLSLSTEELSRHWVTPDDKDFSTEFYVFLPSQNKARTSAVAEQWKVALARQFHLLSSRGRTAVRGISTLTILRDALAASTSASTVQEHVRILAAAMPPDPADGGRGMNRRLFAEGLQELEAQGGERLDEPIDRYAEAAEAWQACATELARPADWKKGDLLDLYAHLASREQAALESLREPLAGWI